MPEGYGCIANRLCDYNVFASTKLLRLNRLEADCWIAADRTPLEEQP